MWRFVMTELPAAAFDPIRMAAVQAMNARDRKPKVEILCAVTSKGLWCANLLGGVWITKHGTVILVNRLGPGDNRAAFKRVSYDREARLRIWSERGFIIEEPVLLQVRGEWHPVPGPFEPPTVRCVRHGEWLLDGEGVIQKLDVARATNKALRFGSAPPS
jgi:hypothetical protein